MFSRPFEQVIGVVGGGQLGKMLIESALSWNVQFNVLDPDENAPCVRYANQFIHGSLTDRDKILELAAISDIITFEIEHIDVETLIEIKKRGKQVIPDPEILKIIQDKSRQKLFFRSNRLDTAEFAVVGNHTELLDFLSDYQGDRVVLKSSTGGYDGKGVWICETTSILSGELPFTFEDAFYVVEEFIEDAREISVIVSRSQNGETAVYPSCEMVFDPQLNLVDYLYSPSDLTPGLESKAEALAGRAIELLDGVGIFAVELFFLPDGRFLINEIAPRPHNSGHHTIEANATSQYEQLMRILLDLPLGSTRGIQPAVMINLIGPQGVEGLYRLEGLPELFSTPGLYLHWYNKHTTRAGRKMGHLTICASTIEEALELARKGKSLIQVKST